MCSPSLSTPVTAMLKKKKTFEWPEKAKVSFEKLKEQTCSALLLHYPYFNRPFSIQWDVDQLPIGAVLVQKDENAEEVPIAQGG